MPMAREQRRAARRLQQCGLGGSSRAGSGKGGWWVLTGAARIQDPEEMERCGRWSICLCKDALSLNKTGKPREKQAQFWALWGKGLSELMPQKHLEPNGCSITAPSTPAQSSLAVSPLAGLGTVFLAVAPKGWAVALKDVGRPKGDSTPPTL